MYVLSQKLELKQQNEMNNQIKKKILFFLHVVYILKKSKKKP